MFVGSVYWYFFNDVVPDHLMGQFLGLFRVVGGLAGILFNQCILQYARTHMTEIFVGIAVLYAVGFGMMCFRVKEGEYPPPPEYVDGKQGLFAGIRTFFVECFSIRFYWFIFGLETFMAMQACVGMFNIFFVEEIGMTLKQYGHINAYAYGISVLLTYPAGIIADKYHPLRVEIVMILILVLMGPLNLIYLFFDMSPQTVYSYYFTVMLISMPARALYVASQLPMYMRLFPKERFGQFCSAQAMICSIGAILGSLIAGGVFDLLKWHYNGSNYAYRWVPVWIWCVQTLGLLCIIQVYRGWKYYGGMKAYLPPLPEKQPASDEVSEAIPQAPEPASALGSQE